MCNEVQTGGAITAFGRVSIRTLHHRNAAVVNSIVCIAVMCTVCPTVLYSSRVFEGIMDALFDPSKKVVVLVLRNACSNPWRIRHAGWYSRTENLSRLLHTWFWCGLLYLCADLTIMEEDKKLSTDFKNGKSSDQQFLLSGLDQFPGIPFPQLYICLSTSKSPIQWWEHVKTFLRKLIGKNMRIWWSFLSCLVLQRITKHTT